MVQLKSMLKQNDKAGFLTIIGVLKNLIDKSDENVKTYDKLVKEAATRCETTSKFFGEQLNATETSIKELNEEIKELEGKFNTTNEDISAIEKNITLYREEINNKNESLILFKETSKINRGILDDAIRILSDIDESIINYSQKKAMPTEQLTDSNCDASDYFNQYQNISQEYLALVPNLAQIASSVEYFQIADDIEVKTCNFGIKTAEELDSGYNTNDIFNDTTILKKHFETLKTELTKRDAEAEDAFKTSVMNIEEIISSKKSAIASIAASKVELEKNVAATKERLNQEIENEKTLRETIPVSEKTCDDTIANYETIGER